MGLRDRFDAARDMTTALSQRPREPHVRDDVGDRASRALDSCLEAYGRCLLSLGTPRAERYANAHMFHRSALFQILNELDVGHDGAPESREAVDRVRDAMARLVKTWDEVLFLAEVPCASTSSGVTGA